MNMMKKILSVITAGIVCLALTACSGSVKEADVMSERAGLYELSALVSQDKESPAEDLEMMKSKGLVCTLTLEEDGTGVLDLFGEKTEVTWTAEEVSAEGKTIPYTYQDKQIILNEDSSSMTFTLTDSAE